MGKFILWNGKKFENAKGNTYIFRDSLLTEEDGEWKAVLAFQGEHFSATGSTAEEALNEAFKVGVEVLQAKIERFNNYFLK